MNVKQYLASIGRKGGKAKTAAKSAAAIANGKLGGRPKKSPKPRARAIQRKPWCRCAQGRAGCSGSPTTGLGRVGSVAGAARCEARFSSGEGMVGGEMPFLGRCCPA